MKNEKLLKAFIFLIFFLIFFPNLASAESSYVLPYPSLMPGNRLYKVRLAWEEIMKYWYFGNFGQFTYNLKESDKYLVEAKTLFEYKQYLLGYKALIKSDQYFFNILPNLIKAKKKNKNILQKKALLNSAAQKHVETLEKMETDSPEVFNWQPEKALLTELNIKKTIENSISLRKQVL